MSVELSSIQLNNHDNRQLNEQFKQRLSREIGELRNKLDLVSDRYNLATDFQCQAAAVNQPYGIAPLGQPSTVLPLNTFILVPVSLTQPPVGPTLNQPNQRQPSGELRCPPQPGQLVNQSRPNNDDQSAHLNRAVLDQQLTTQQLTAQQLSQPNYLASSLSSHYLCDDNFSRVGGDLEALNKNRMLLNGTRQQQQPMSRSNQKFQSSLFSLPSANNAAGLVRPAKPGQQQQQKVGVRLVRKSDGSVAVLNLVESDDVQ